MIGRTARIFFSSRIKYTTDWLRVVLCISFFLEFIVTKNAWYQPADIYPKVPLILSWPLELPPAISLGLYSLLLVSCLMMLSRKFFRFFLVIFLSILLLFFLEDINRLQPWIYIHGIMLVLLTSLKNKPEEMSGWLMVFMYFWGGINKLNLNFAWFVFPYFMEPFGLNESFFLDYTEIGRYPLPGINHFAWIVPAFEIAISIGLIIKRTRKFAAFSGIILHLLTLYILGPFGMNWNSIVWVWNTELILLLWILFIKEESSISLNVFKRTLLNTGAGILAGIFPLLWYFGFWPHVLSFHLYSGYNPNLEYWFYEGNDKIWNSPYQENGLIFEDSTTGEKTIMVDIYGAEENNLPVFSEEVYFRYTGKKLCEYFDGNGEYAGILIKARKKFTAEYDLKRFTCGELLEE